MKNIEVFTTPDGVASLTLDQIPYNKKAYVRIQCAINEQQLIEDCVSFCRAVGAEIVLGAQLHSTSEYRSYTDILKMVCNKCDIEESEACLFPVTEETFEQWRQIYNNKMQSVPNSAVLSQIEFHDFINQNEAYFVHESNTLIGIGAVQDHQIIVVCSLKSGAGRKIVAALCKAIIDDEVFLEVASENRKAVELYEKMGFFAVEVLSSWYVLYP